MLVTKQRTATNLRGQQLMASVPLIKALGGGWDVSHSQVMSTPNAQLESTPFADFAECVDQ